MKKTILSLIVGSFMAMTSFAQNTTWSVDKTHTNIGFTVTHMMVSEVDGNFKSYDGSIKSDKPDFSDAKFTFSVDVASVNTGNDQRDGHLKGDDFFSAEKFPKISFESTSLKANGKGKYKMPGNLTMKGVTKSVTFDLVYNGTVKDPYGNTKAGFKAVGKIKRKDFGLTWNTMVEAGPAVSDEVELNIKGEFAKAK
jgi:polyisoprenoid-binding protein YceI